MNEIGHVVARAPLFGVLCRFVEQKGIKYLLDALKLYRDRRGDVNFTFAGQGDLEGMIRDFVADNDLQNIRIVRVEDAAEILSKIDVFVHPSIGDAMPVSIAEALMCSCPCVVCRVGGVPDLVRDGEEGFVIEPHRTDEILRCMELFGDMDQKELDAFKNRA